MLSIGDQFDGNIDEVIFYNKALSETEISQLYIGGLYDGNRIGATQTTAGEEWIVGFKTKSLLGEWTTDTNSASVTITE